MNSFRELFGLIFVCLILATLVVGDFLTTRWIIRKTKGLKGWGNILRVALISLPSASLACILGVNFLTLSMHHAALPTAAERAEPPTTADREKPPAREEEPRIERDEAGAPPLPAFPWPPPSPSAREVIPQEAFNASNVLGDETGKIETALRSKGYAEITYWGVPDGVAVVTRLEHIYPDGRPFAGSRWAVNDAGMQALSIHDYINRLFGVDDGYYRVVVFVITDQGFGASGVKTSETDTLQWLSHGFQSIPKQLASARLTPGYTCTALIYEFRKPQGQDPTLLLPSEIGAQEHMVASGLWSAITGVPN